MMVRKEATSRGRFPTQLTTNFTTDVEQVPVTAQFQELRDEQNSIPNAWNTVEIEQFDKCDDVGTAIEQEVMNG